MKDRSGKEITTKEFFQRWKQGVQEVTPLQQTALNFVGFGLVMLGIAIGLYTTWRLDTWWLFIILLGSWFLTTISLIGNLQKYLVLKKIEDVMKGGLQNVNE